ncbi:MAG: hypothetical protein IT555_14985 [Acetobacteraceae bacterium]|nr:hypothetical protein [Acetobacteraceae bacterium]
MARLLLPVLLILAGCTPPPAPPPVHLASVTPDIDPALMDIFFGPGQHRAISPVIRCPVRCQLSQ